MFVRSGSIVARRASASSDVDDGGTPSSDDVVRDAGTGDADIDVVIAPGTVTSEDRDDGNSDDDVVAEAVVYDIVDDDVLTAAQMDANAGSDGNEGEEDEDAQLE